MKVASVTTYYPQPHRPADGVFLPRRLGALCPAADVRVIHLRPWFPVLKPCDARERVKPDTAVRTDPRRRGFSPAEPGGLQPTLEDGPPVVRVPMFYIPGVLKGLDARWLERALLPALREIERDGPVDLIDAHFGYPEGVGAWRAGERLGRPVFITMHGVEDGMLEDRARGAQLAQALRSCAGVISVSRSLVRVAASAGVPPERLTVIPYPVDRSVFYPGPARVARDALRLALDGRLLVSVGMLEHRKGHHVAVEALGRLRERWPELRLAVVGGATHERRYPRMLEQRIAQLGLRQAVILPGTVPPDQVAAWLRAADVFVLATEFEACPNAVLEALACGLPVVTTPTGDNADFLGERERGLLVPPGDAAALASTIDAALRKDWLREQIASFRADYTPDRCARRIEEFFHERLRDWHAVGSQANATPDSIGRP